MFFMDASISLEVEVENVLEQVIGDSLPTTEPLIPALWFAIPFGLNGAITSPSSDSRKNGMYHSLSTQPSHQR